MENIKENISQNLIKLRKEHKLTQQEFAKNLNYSDKAVSRWERGESMPDIDILTKICEYYGVEFEWLIHKNEEVHIKKSQTNQYKIAIVILFVLSIFTIATIAFTYYQITSNKSLWILYVWACPLSFFTTLVFAKNWWSTIIQLVFGSLTMWSFLTCMYLQFLTYNIWPIYFVGIPLQLVFVLLTYISKTKKK